MEFKGDSNVSVRLIFISKNLKNKRETRTITSRSSRERVTLNLLDLPNDRRAALR